MPIRPRAAQLHVHARGKADRATRGAKSSRGSMRNAGAAAQARPSALPHGRRAAAARGTKLQPPEGLPHQAMPSRCFTRISRESCESGEGRRGCVAIAPGRKHRAAGTWYALQAGVRRRPSARQARPLAALRISSKVVTAAASTWDGHGPSAACRAGPRLARPSRNAAAAAVCPAPQRGSRRTWLGS